MSAPLVLHLVAADGATFDVSVQLPPIRTGQAVVRIVDVRAFSVGGVNKWISGQWVTQP